jgi:RNA 2',3'-cyclic 3'-phosphodiesterase
LSVSCAFVTRRLTHAAAAGRQGAMRLFVALDLPWPLPERLSAMAGGLPGARWVPPENYHLTLRFVGEVPGHRADEIDLALGAVRARGFPLVLAGVGSFARAETPQSLHVSVARNPALEHLRQKVDTALVRAGVAPERRRFSPHVTLARLDAVPEARLVGWLQAHNLFEAEPVAIRSFTLFSSRRGAERSVYVPEVEYALE